MRVTVDVPLLTEPERGESQAVASNLESGLNALIKSFTTTDAYHPVGRVNLSDPKLFRMVLRQLLCLPCQMTVPIQNAEWAVSAKCCLRHRVVARVALQYFHQTTSLAGRVL